ncbi:MAG: ADP-ribosylation factor family protein [Candidatus Hodarchaeota archaeon]
MSFLAKLRAIRAKKDRLMKVAWLGLDHAGKTTLIKRILRGTFDESNIRTLGMNVEEIKSGKRIRIICWDLGGQETFRDALWAEYLRGSMGIVYVIDAADHERFPLAREELWKYVIDNPMIQRIPILILANKQDLQNVATPGQVARAMSLHKVHNHSYAIFPTSAASGYNVFEAIEWIQQRLTDKIKTL